MTLREFICSVCGRGFLTPTTEAEANKEFLESGQTTSEDTTLLSACDECYQVVMSRARRAGIIE